MNALGKTVDKDNFSTEESNLFHSRFVSAPVLPKMNNNRICWLGESESVGGFINEERL